MDCQKDYRYCSLEKQVVHIGLENVHCQRNPRSMEQELNRVIEGD